MPVSQLIPLFNSLKKEDIRHCRKLIASPIYNPSARGENYLLALFKALEENKKEEIDDKKLWKKTFKSKICDKLVLARLKSDLTDLIEEFLILREFRNDPFQRDLYLLKALRTNSMEAGFIKTYNDIEEDLKDKSQTDEKEESPTRRYKTKEILLKNADFHLYLSKINHEYYKNYIAQKRDLPKHFDDSNIQLTYYIVAQKLRSLCEVMSNKSVVSSEKNLLEHPLDAYIVTYAQSIKDDSDTPIIIKIYLTCYKMLKKNTSEKDKIKAFEQLKEWVINNNKIFETEELESLFGILINFATARLNKGVTAFLQKSLDLYKLGLASKLLLSDGVLSHFVFKNIVFVAARSKEFDWARNFIEEYNNNLLLDYRDNFITYCYAIIDFNQLNYDNTIRLLATVRLPDARFEADIRRMLVRSAFETNELDLLKYHLNNFQNFINFDSTKTALGYLYKNYSNFIRFTRAWSKATNDEERNEIRAAFNAEENIAEKDWLGNKMGLNELVF